MTYYLNTTNSIDTSLFELQFHQMLKIQKKIDIICVLYVTARKTYHVVCLLERRTAGGRQLVAQGSNLHPPSGGQQSQCHWNQERDKGTTTGTRQHHVTGTGEHGILGSS